MEDAAATARGNASALEADNDGVAGCIGKVKAIAEERRRVIAQRFGSFAAAGTTSKRGR